MERGGSGLGKLYWNRATEVEGVENFVDKARVVLRDDSACITSFVGDAGIGDVEDNVEGELGGDLAGKGALVD